MEYDNAIGYSRKEMKMNKVVYEIGINGGTLANEE